MCSWERTGDQATGKDRRTGAHHFSPSVLPSASSPSHVTTAPPSSRSIENPSISCQHPTRDGRFSSRSPRHSRPTRSRSRPTALSARSWMAPPRLSCSQVDAAPRHPRRTCAGYDDLRDPAPLEQLSRGIIRRRPKAAHKIRDRHWTSRLVFPPVQLPSTIRTDSPAQSTRLYPGFLPDEPHELMVVCLGRSNLACPERRVPDPRPRGPGTSPLFPLPRSFTLDCFLS